MASEAEIKEQGEANTSLFGWINRRKVQKSAASWQSEDTKDKPLIAKRDSDESYALSAIILPFLFPALGGLLYGYDIGATSGADISIESAELSGTDWYNLSSIANGVVVSGSLFGALIGSIIAFNVADILGRRRELIVASLLYAIGALISALALDLAMLIIGRLIYGFGIGLASFGPIGWLMISEIFPLRTRGRGLSIAVLVNFSANALVTFSFSPLRVLLGAAILFLIFGIIDIVALFFIIFLVPETKGLTLEEIESKILK